MPAGPSTLSVIVSGAADWRRWAWLGFNDVRLQNRRSALGMWWSTLSLGIFAFGVGFLFSRLMGRPIEEFLPHISLGWLSWGLIQGGVVQGCSVFISGRTVLEEAVLPPTTLLLRVLMRFFLQFVMGLAVPIAAFIAVMRPLPPTAFAAIAGLALCLATLHGAMLFLGVVCARFRDLQHLVEAGMRLAFFITPIIWMPDAVNNERGAFIDYNPFYYMIETIRAPFTEGRIPLFELGVVAGLAVAANLAGLIAFAIARRRLIYWL